MKSIRTLAAENFALRALSRRQFVGYGGALCALAPSIARAQAAPDAAQAAEKIAAATDAARHLSVNTTINGKGPFRFVVDTGADRTILTDDVAAALGLAPDKDVIVEGIIRTVQTKSVFVRDFSVGPINRKNMNVPILPRTMLDADGYLGIDVVDDYRVTLDFANKILEIGTSAALPRRMQFPNEARVSVYGPAGHLRSVDCEVDNISATAFIDTGAEVTIGNLPLYNALLANDPKHVATEKVQIEGITGGTIEGSVVALRKVDLSAMNFLHCNIAVAPLPIFDLWGLADRPALLIGMNWLRQFERVSIDYGAKELRFQLAKLFLASLA